MGRVTVRAATPADAGLIADLVREHAAYEGQAAAARGTAEDVAAALPSLECLIAEVAGEPVGFAMAFANHSSWDGRPGLFLEDLFVREAARGLGVGRLLLAELARRVRTRGGTRLDLVVSEGNPARRFYERLGLREVPGWRLYRADLATLERLDEPETG